MVISLTVKESNRLTVKPQTPDASRDRLTRERVTNHERKDEQ